MIMADGTAGTVAGIMATRTAAVSAVMAVSPIMAEAVTTVVAAMVEAAAGMAAERLPESAIEDRGCVQASSTQPRAD
jgi:hypothetical protein